MKEKLQFFILVSVLFFSCNTNKKENSIEKWKQEVINTELAFSELSEKEGVPVAFLTYAADDVVTKGGTGLIIGKESLRKSYKSLEKSTNTSLVWKPDFVDVSSSGDLAYTYGHYIYTVIDSTGKAKADTGIFHTVWKRQPDGQWKFVWD